MIHSEKDDYLGGGMENVDLDLVDRQQKFTDAVRANDLTEVEKALRAGIDLNYVNKDQSRPIDVVFETASLEVITAVLDSGKVSTSDQKEVKRLAALVKKRDDYWKILPAFEKYTAQSSQNVSPRTLTTILSCLLGFVCAKFFGLVWGIVLAIALGIAFEIIASKLHR